MSKIFPTAALVKDSYIQYLTSTYPHLETSALNDLISDNLLSNSQIAISEDILNQAKNFISACFQLRENKTYQNFYSTVLDQKALKDPGNKSIMMSYDFHYDSNKGLQLIEINTNAAFLILGVALQKTHDLELLTSFDLDNLKACIENEVLLCKGALPKGPLKIAILDEKPNSQRLFVEFLVAKELFQSWGWEVQIIDIEDYKSGEYDFVYNRCTDFFLEDVRNQNLRRDFVNRAVCLSPHPFEYFLLADKERMLDWNPNQLRQWGISEEQIETFEKHLPFCQILKPENADLIWQNRKTLFFKPMRAFGSKQTYKGASISRKAFDEICNGNFIAQAYIPAPEVDVLVDGNHQKMKYDLRFYAYQDQLQFGVARLYQGQVTNLRTLGGGFAPLSLNKSLK